MRFQSKWNNTSYVVKANTYMFYPGLGKEKVPGLVAKFTGPQRIFDSEKTALERGWTDEQREWVERHLLRHPDFGRGIYLAPGEEMTQEQATLVRDPQRIPKKRCASFALDGDEINQCSAMASLGSEYCEDHDPEKNKITKGMTTTQQGAVKA